MPSRPPLSQDPHGGARAGEKNLEVAIGRAIRRIRHERNLTVAALSRETGLSPGMISKIETGSASASLATLKALSEALSVPLTAFLKDYEERREAVHTPAGTAVEVERRGTRSGHQYALLGHIVSNASGVIVEPYLITLTSESDLFPSFQHDGLEVLYMLEGELEYAHADRLYCLRPGDTLFFEADAKHGPFRHIRLPARFLAIIAYRAPD